jgi:hypothetical protein
MKEEEDRRQASMTKVEGKRKMDFTWDDELDNTDLPDVGEFVYRPTSDLSEQEIDARMARYEEDISASILEMEKETQARIDAGELDEYGCPITPSTRSPVDPYKQLEDLDWSADERED